MHTGQKKNWHHLNKSSFVGVVCADFSNGFPVSFLSLLLKRMKRRTNVRKNMRSRGFARSWLCPPRRGPFFFSLFPFLPLRGSAPPLAPQSPTSVPFLFVQKLPPDPVCRRQPRLGATAPRTVVAAAPLHETKGSPMMPHTSTSPTPRSRLQH
jgi:hypothetical protein